MKQLKIILTYGLPASGKTTWAEQFAIENNYTNICKDDIRLANPTYKEKKVIIERDLKTRESLSSGKSAIWSDTNLNPIHKKMAEEIAKEFNATVEIKDFSDVPLEECLKRDIHRGVKAVGDQVIKKMYYEYLFAPQKPIETPQLDTCYIFDIDGTLAIKSPERGYFEWDKVGLDFPNIPVLTVFFYLANAMVLRPKIFIFSGRDESCREETIKWLGEYINIDDYILLMRPKNNTEDDRIIKEKMYENHIKGKYNVLGIFDDRPKVCRMWRQLGLPVFQVGNPDVDF
jgi:predicted kinase